VHLPFQLRHCNRVDKHNHADEQVEAQRVVMLAEETEIQSLKGKIDTILAMSGQKDTENQRLHTVVADNEQLIVQLNRDIKALNHAFIFLVSDTTTGLTNMITQRSAMRLTRILRR
jgi:hypothetical protein